MIKTKMRNFILLGTILYTVLILYFLFFAFNRADQATSIYGYKFMLVPEAVPLRFPQLSFSWLYDFGNIAAFIPFGILIPLLFRIDFRKFIIFFILVILFLETLQSITFLGTFDIDDVISNTLGAIVGFIGYRVGFSSKITPQKFIASILSIFLLITGIMVVSEAINFMAQKREGSIQSLSNFEETNNSIAKTKKLPSFTVLGNKVEPKWNLYSSEDGKSKEYTYHLGNKKDVMFYAYYGIPDNVDFKGEVSIIADGNFFFQCSDEYAEDIVPAQMHFDQINEIKIIVTGNAKIWDVGITESKHCWE
nr:VanZ family protein [uncultured Aminipila sp.]